MLPLSIAVVVRPVQEIQSGNLQTMTESRTANAHDSVFNAYAPMLNFHVEKAGLLFQISYDSSTLDTLQAGRVIG